jgi:hypothetical protein
MPWRKAFLSPNRRDVYFGKLYGKSPNDVIRPLILATFFVAAGFGSTERVRLSASLLSPAHSAFTLNYIRCCCCLALA